ncbi:MAG TPA: single-stranded DNA-binding protein, partial [Oscillospiraceae bacterium]|nr:single-stranded DNA-binding protein [Oscillospiraceae bacterium]
NIALAYNYGRKGEDGNKPTQWLEIAVWGKQAEGLAQYLTKGKQVYVVVKDVRVETFAKNDGTQSFKLVGDLADIKFASDGQQQQQQSYPQQQAQQQQGATPPPGYVAPQQQPAYQQQAPQNQFQQNGVMDDDIPFN